MRLLLLPAALGTSLLLTALAAAQPPAPMPKTEPIPQPKAETLPPPASVPLAPPCAGGCQTEKTICLPKVLLVEEQQAITVPVMRLREQVVGRDVIHKIEVTYVEEKHTVTEMKTVPRIVEQQVCTSKMVPQASVDCNGKPCTVYTKVPEVKTVKITVFDVVPVQREVIVRMPCLKPVDVEVEVRKLVVDETEEAAILKRWNLNITPNEIKVMLPACPIPLLP